MSVRIAVIYYSATGNVARLAEALAEGAATADAEVRLRRVAELAPEAAIDSNPAWRAHYDETASTVAEARVEDLEWASSPSRAATSLPQACCSACWAGAAALDAIVAHGIDQAEKPGLLLPAPNSHAQLRRRRRDRSVRRRSPQAAPSVPLLVLLFRALTARSPCGTHVRSMAPGRPGTRRGFSRLELVGSHTDLGALADGRSGAPGSAPSNRGRCSGAGVTRRPWAAAALK